MNIATSRHFKKAYLPNDEINHAAIYDFLEIKRTEIARMLEVTPDAIRNDKRISFKQKKQSLRILNLIELVADHFSGDLLKTYTWFIVTNPCLEWKAPKDLILNKKIEELEKNILESLRK